MAAVVKGLPRLIWSYSFPSISGIVEESKTKDFIQNFIMEIFHNQSQILLSDAYAWTPKIAHYGCTAGF